MFAVLKRNPIALLFALALHVALGWFLVVGIDWQEKPKAPKSDAQVVQAKVVDQQDLAQEVKQLQQAKQEKQKAEEKRLAELKKRREDEKRRLAEIERKRKKQEQLEAKRRAKLKQQQAAEKQRLLKLKQEREAAERKRIAEEKKRQQAEKKRKAEEAKRKVEAEKKRQEAERKRLAAERRAREEQAKRERELAAQFAAEQAASEAARIARLIQQKVTRYWKRPPGTAEQGLTCRVQVRLGANGSVLAVDIVQSSGHTAFDRSVASAVWKADPLPMPDDPDLRNRNEFRQHTFIFDPAKGAL